MIQNIVPPPTRHLLDAKQLASKLGCSWRTVYRMADAGQIPFGIKIGALRRWDAIEIDRWIAEGAKPIRRAN